MTAFAPPTGTARIALRPFAPGDGDDLYALDSLPEVMRYIGDGSVVTDRAVCEGAIPIIMRRYVEHPGTGVVARVAPR